MAAPKHQTNPPLTLVWGEDDYSVKKRAAELYKMWCEEVGGFDHEIVDASVSNVGEALKSLARLREALQTLPFFGSGKVVWFRNCSFLGEDRVASGSTVSDALTEWVQELKVFRWEGVRLLISAGKVDKRRAFYKYFEKSGQVEAFPGLSAEDKDWSMRAEGVAGKHLHVLGKKMSPEAMDQFIASIGPQVRQLINEIEKLALYVGDRPRIEPEDVAAIVSRQKQARAFAVGEAFGDRDLAALLRALDEAMWEIKTDTQKSSIGLLYGIISKVRVMIILQELIRAGYIKADADYGRFKSQLDRIPPDLIPGEAKANPLSQHPYVLFKALPQTRRYTQAELVKALEVLLECNQKLVSSDLDDAFILQHALTRIVVPAEETSVR